MTAQSHTKAIDRPGVLDALRAIRAEAHRLEQADGYQFASVRGLVTKLGLTELFDDVLDACYEGGFQYCLDRTRSATHFDPNNPAAVDSMVTDYPPQSACEWGADQLRSRLDCVDYRVYR